MQWGRSMAGSPPSALLHMCSSRSPGATTARTGSDGQGRGTSERNWAAARPQALSSCSALLPDRLPCFPGAINCWPGPARPPRPPHGGVSAMSYEERAAQPGLRSRAPTRSRPRSSLLLHAPEPLSSCSHPAHAAALEGFTPWDPCASWFSKEGWLECGVYPGRAGRWLADSFRNTL